MADTIADWLSLLTGGGTSSLLATPATGFDPAAAQAAQAERQLARRRRGRGAMLLTGAQGLDPAAAGTSVARRLLTGATPNPLAAAP